MIPTAYCVLLPVVRCHMHCIPVVSHTVDTYSLAWPDPLPRRALSLAV